jgi:ribonucleotide monophosphatase NagD (HAD superfamily)
MVGDDVEADVAAAMALGIQGCLVQTGKYQEQRIRIYSLPAQG